MSTHTMKSPEPLGEKSTNGSEKSTVTHEKTPEDRKMHKLPPEATDELERIVEIYANQQERRLALVTAIRKAGNAPSEDLKRLEQILA